MSTVKLDLERALKDRGYKPWKVFFVKTIAGLTVRVGLSAPRSDNDVEVDVLVAKGPDPSHPTLDTARFTIKGRGYQRVLAFIDSYEETWNPAI